MTRSKSVVLVMAAVLVIAVAGGVLAGMRGNGKRTPCEAAVETVDEIREQDPQTIGFAEQNGAGYGLMLRGLITGRFEDVEGKASPVVAGHLRTVADDLATAQAAPAGEFTTGETGRDMDALVAACEDEG